MEAIRKEFESRKDEIRNGVEMLFKANMKITDWDIPEVNDRDAAKILLSIMQEALSEVTKDVEEGKYNNY